LTESSDNARNESAASKLQGDRQMTNLRSPEGIPLATVLRLNAARTIPLERYEEDGCFDRYGYIRDLADDHGVDLPMAIEMAELLGPEEDFDGLVCTLEDMADRSF